MKKKKEQSLKKMATKMIIKKQMSVLKGGRNSIVVDDAEGI
jgi:hypothetical protein